MTGQTHLSAGFACGCTYVLLQGVSDPVQIVAAVGAAVAGSLLPDIDCPQAMLSRASFAARTVSASVSLITSHRGITHTAAFAGFIYAACELLCRELPALPMLGPLPLCLTIGVLSHQLLDMLNPQGVMWLWPILRARIRVMRVRTGAISEKLIQLLFRVAYIMETYQIGVMLLRQHQG